VQLKHAFEAQFVHQLATEPREGNFAYAQGDHGHQDVVVLVRGGYSRVPNEDGIAEDSGDEPCIECHHHATKDEERVGQTHAAVDQQLCRVFDELRHCFVLVILLVEKVSFVLVILLVEKKVNLHVSLLLDLIYLFDVHYQIHIFHWFVGNMLVIVGYIARKRNHDIIVISFN